jgi:hypothetical protein
MGSAAVEFSSMLMSAIKSHDNDELSQVTVPLYSEDSPLAGPESWRARA